MSLSASLVGDWRQYTLALPWVEPVHHLCKEFTVPDKRNWQSLPLSALQILEIAIKHLDKISRWWQGKENDQSQALLNPLNITYGLDVAVTRHSLILGEFSGRALFSGSVTRADPNNTVDRRRQRKAKAGLPQGMQFSVVASLHKSQERLLAAKPCLEHSA